MLGSGKLTPSPLAFSSFEAVLLKQDAIPACGSRFSRDTLLSGRSSQKHHRSTGSPSAKQSSVLGSWLNFSIPHFRSELQKPCFQTRGTFTLAYACLLRAHQPSAFSAQPFLFVGSQGVMEELPGLYFMRARYYSADAGVFLSTDLMKHIGPGWKPLAYAYADEDPLRNSDPTGEFFLFMGQPTEWDLILQKVPHWGMFADPFTKPFKELLKPQLTLPHAIRPKPPWLHHPPATPAQAPSAAAAEANPVLATATTVSRKPCRP